MTHPCPKCDDVSVKQITERFMDGSQALDGNPLAAAYRADVGYLLSHSDELERRLQVARESLVWIAKGRRPAQQRAIEAIRQIDAPYEGEK